MSPEMLMMVESASGTLLGLIEKQSSATTAGELCTLQAGISSATQMLTMYKMMQCNSAVTKCSQSCSKFQSAAQSAASSARTAAANTATSSVNMSLGAVMPALPATVLAAAQEDLNQASQASSQCKGSSDASMMLMVLEMNGLSSASSSAEDCAGKLATATAVPTPVAAVDCTNATVAVSNSVCICQADPSNAICGTTSVASTTSGVSTSTAASNHPFVADSTLSSGGVPTTAPTAAAAQTGTNQVSGGGGSGLSGGSGSSGPSGSSDGTTQNANGIDKNVITGQSNGGGSGAASGLSASGSSGAGSGKNSSGGSEKNNDVNFKALLPKKKDYLGRGLAGMTVQAVDGITGPFGPSLFEKVSNRMAIKLQQGQVDPNALVVPMGPTIKSAAQEQR
jgi:hypothetical protein